MGQLIAAFEPLGVVMTIIGLGGLIFFHELGHFLACRLTKTRVEAFSVGFGKEIFGWTRKGTRYRIGMIPLGGYVKMAAENPGERNTGAPDEFPNKPFSARLFIMSAGVLFNLVLAFALFVWAFGSGVPLKSREIGYVTQGSPAWHAGVRKGDVVTHVDGRDVLDFIDLLTESMLGGNEPVVLTVERDGRSMDVAVPPGEAGGDFRLGVRPAVEPAAREVFPDSPAARAGGRPGDVVLAVGADPVTSAYDIPFLLDDAAAAAPAGAEELDLPVRVLRENGTQEVLAVRLPLEDRPMVGITSFAGPRVDAVARGSVADGVVRPGDELRVNGTPVRDVLLLRGSREPVSSLDVLRDGAEVAVRLPPGTTAGDLGDALLGRADSGTTLVTPQPDSPAARAGIEPGDRIVAVAGKAVATFEDISNAIVANGVRPVEMEIERGGERTKVTVMPARRPADLGYSNAIAQTMHRERNVFRAMGLGWKRTVRFIEMVLMTVQGLVTRRVSSESIGGPIALVTATYSMFDEGWGLYLHILGLISVNLAILNLLPIPILDGGQIVLLVAEKLRGKPLPERVVGYLQMAGLVMILGLLVLAFKNDIARLIQ